MFEGIPHVILILLVQCCNVFTMKVWTREGPCPDYSIRLGQKLDLKQLQGEWYYFASYGAPLHSTCVSSNFTLINNNTLEMYFYGYRIIQKDWYTTNATAVFPNSDKNTEFKLTLNENYIGWSVITWTPNPKYITSIGYNKYVMWWSCYNYLQKNRHIEYCDIFSRRPLTASREDEHLRKTIIQEFEANKAKTTEENIWPSIEFVRHVNCTASPEKPKRVSIKEKLKEKEIQQQREKQMMKEKQEEMEMEKEVEREVIQEEEWEMEEEAQVIKEVEKEERLEQREKEKLKRELEKQRAIEIQEQMKLQKASGEDKAKEKAEQKSFKSGAQKEHKTEKLETKAESKEVKKVRDKIINKINEIKKEINQKKDKDKET